MMGDVEAVYKALADSMKSLVARSNVTAEDMNKLKDVIRNVKSLEELRACKESLFHILRYLRNSCIQCEKNQNLIINTSVLEEVCRLINMIYDPGLENFMMNSDDVCKMKLTAIQFLGNLVVQNKAAKLKVWKFCFPTLFFNMLSCLDGKGKDYMCMVIYNCLKDQCNFVKTDEECWLLSSILEHCKSYAQVEWGLLVIELVIVSKNFIVLYQHLGDYPEIKGSLLEITMDYLRDDGVDSVKIPEENLIYLSEQFEAKSACIVLLTNNMSEDMAKECELLFKILSVLSASTGYAEQYKGLRSSHKLMKIAVDLLKQISVCTQPDISDSINFDEHHPFFGLKRNLVRIIGNMCYKNKVMQEYIREISGIADVLNCCCIDDRNPFIMQWAVFAIRNISEDNLENQAFISAFENHGVVTNSLSGINVSARLENGRIKISSNS